MNRGVKIVAMVLLFSLMMVALVGAVPERAIPVKATEVFTATTFSDMGLNKGGIFFFDMVATGTVKLYITSTAIPDYELKSTVVHNGTINTKTDLGEGRRKILWELIGADGTVLGAFEGEAKAKTTTYLYRPDNGYPRAQFSDNYYHAVLQGSGKFDGQTLKLDGIRPTVPVTDPVTSPAKPHSWEGILLIH